METYWLLRHVGSVETHYYQENQNNTFYNKNIVNINDTQSDNLSLNESIKLNSTTEVQPFINNIDYDKDQLERGMYEHMYKK